MTRAMTSSFKFGVRRIGEQEDKLLTKHTYLMGIKFTDGSLGLLSINKTNSFIVLEALRKTPHNSENGSMGCRWVAPDEPSSSSSTPKADCGPMAAGIGPAEPPPANDPHWEYHDQPKPWHTSRRLRTYRLSKGAGRIQGERKTVY